MIQSFFYKSLEYHGNHYLFQYTFSFNEYDVLNLYIRHLALGFYLVLPHFALICVAIIKAKGSGWFFLTGWCTAFIFQVFFIAVNQSNKNNTLPLYKEAGALFLPVLVLIKQIAYGGGFMLYILELMAIEVLVLNIGVIIAMVLMAKDDWQGALFGSVFFSLFLIATFSGLYFNWSTINTDTSLINYYFLAFAILSGVIINIKFLLSVGRSEIHLQDAEIKNPVLFFVGQLGLWFVIIVSLDIIF